jgi:NAD-dependent DNA ligase
MGLLDLLRSSALPTMSKTVDGQAPIAAFRGHAVQTRQVDELIGLCKGVLLDGAVSSNEAEGLLAWLEANRAAANSWPGNALYQRLQRALQDGELDEAEEKELLGIIVGMVSGPPTAEEPVNRTTLLPLDNPPPLILFEARTFCFTGQFASGSRQWCEQQVLQRGGVPKSTITKKLDYLVIGEVGSRDWVHSTHGRKIESAVELKQSGSPICIVGERHWHSAILG